MGDREDLVIEKLESKAAELRTLLGYRGAKRPLVLEFSGSPKSGKTMAVSRLDLFLRRNGIAVATLAERASAAPIRKKGHFYFNVWVSCASLQGMLESLQSDADIFILDRGLFDGLVWNTWLGLTGKIAKDEMDAFAEFFAMGRWTELTDLICVMTCDPSASIEREYAGQLTRRRGNIMDENVLRLVNESIDATIEKFGKRFKKVLRVDTTWTNPVEGVAKITTETLSTLHEFLDEPICVVPRSSIDFDMPGSGFVADHQKVQSFFRIVNERKKLVPRSRAEKDPDCLIPVACAIIKFEDKVLLLRRREEGHSLHDTYAIWAGGHVLRADSEGSDTLLECVKRELSEEVYIRDEYEVSPVGLVRTDQDERAWRHIGVVYQARLSSPHVALALNQKEFRETRGTSMSGRLVEVTRLNEFFNEMGDWSKFIVCHYWPEQGTGGQMRLQLFS